MGGLTRTNDPAVELDRLKRKLERRLKALFIQAGRVSRRIGSGEASGSRLGARTPLSALRKLLMTLSDKAAPLLHRKKIAGEEKQDSYGAGGLWQRDILMGEKCQPLDFSGAIYYDNQGKRLTGLPPRSPRGGSSPMVQSYPFQVPLAQKSG
ncbi:hypothetical protein AAC387_Pa07g3089 [Persea americana]